MEPVEQLRRFQAEYRGLAASRQAFDARRASDPAFAAEIETLYGCFIGTFRRYCGNCWHDAFLELMTLKNMDNKSQFRVLAGTLLHDPVNRDVNFMLTPRRLAERGDDLALRHLAHNPDAADYFEKPLPANLDRMIAEYRKRERAAAEGSPAGGKTSEKRAAKATRRAGTPRTKVQAAAKAEAKAEQSAGEVSEAPAPDEAPGKE